MIKTAEISASDTVLEVGSGRGELTFDLTRHAGRVIAVEKDEKLATRLREELRRRQVKNVSVIPGDILKLSSVPNLVRYKAVGNIPYYLTSRLIRILLEDEPRPEMIVFTVQKEVAQKIVAKPPQMNLLALSIQAFGRPEIVKTVPASCFSPRPKVDSAIIKISDISDQFFQKNRLDGAEFFEILRRAFSQKRKLLKNSLSLNLTRPGLVNIRARPQELSLEQWAKIVTAITKTRG